MGLHYVLCWKSVNIRGILESTGKVLTSVRSPLLKIELCNIIFGINGFIIFLSFKICFLIDNHWLKGKMYFVISPKSHVFSELYSGCVRWLTIWSMTNFFEFNLSVILWFLGMVEIRVFMQISIFDNTVIVTVDFISDYYWHSRFMVTYLLCLTQILVS